MYLHIGSSISVSRCTTISGEDSTTLTGVLGLASLVFHFRLLQLEHRIGIVALNQTYPHDSQVQSYALISLIMALQYHLRHYSTNSPYSLPSRTHSQNGYYRVL